MMARRYRMGLLSPYQNQHCIAFTSTTWTNVVLPDPAIPRQIRQVAIFSLADILKACSDAFV